MTIANAPKSNASQNWTNIVTGFLKASSVFTNEDGALMEVACERKGMCDIDQRAFKGIAARSFGRAAQVAPIVAKPIQTLLLASAKSATNNCEGSGEDVACTFGWAEKSNITNEQATAGEGNLGEVLNALQAVQALLWYTFDTTAAGAGNQTSSNSSSPNATTSENPLGTSGSISQHTGAGATLVSSFTFILAVAFAAALSC
jgi:mannan endo-1,6-alpha-mannosidase